MSGETPDLQSFMQHHYAGTIPSHAYDDYKDRGGVAWLGAPHGYPELLGTKSFAGREIKFRQEGRKVKYVKLDAAGEVVRDGEGVAKYMTDKEVRVAGYALYDQTIVAFDGDEPIGWAANEFGSVGVWVVEDSQRMGIGTYLLSEHMKQRKPDTKIGHMTPAGANLVAAYHRHLSEGS
jgi:GNAT superfamily N-acetyltransferase